MREIDKNVMEMSVKGDLLQKGKKSCEFWETEFQRWRQVMSCFGMTKGEKKGGEKKKREEQQKFDGCIKNTNQL